MRGQQGPPMRKMDKAADYRGLQAKFHIYQLKGLSLSFSPSQPFFFVCLFV